MPRESRVRPLITEADLYKADFITPQMASDYLGSGVSQQGARVLARSGKIGEPIPGTNRVFIQAKKLIAFKSGEIDHEKWCRTLAQVFKEEGLNDLAADIAVAIINIANKHHESEV